VAFFAPFLVAIGFSLAIEFIDEWKTGT
jgi:hypothetical protein